MSFEGENKPDSFHCSNNLSCTPLAPSSLHDGGAAWSCMVLCGNAWSCVVLRGLAWSCVVLCGGAA